MFVPQAATVLPIGTSWILIFYLDLVYKDPFGYYLNTLMRLFSSDSHLNMMRLGLDAYSIQYEGQRIHDIGSGITGSWFERTGMRDA